MKILDTILIIIASLFVIIIYIFLLFTSDLYSYTYLKQIKGNFVYTPQGSRFYIDPNKEIRLTVNNYIDLFRIAAKYALGISNENLFKIRKFNFLDTNKKNFCKSFSIAKKLSGRLLLQVENKGEIWYVIPGQCVRVKFDAENFEKIIKKVSLPIKYINIVRIPVEGGKKVFFEL